MSYKGGTPKAQACLERLKELGSLVDVYSHAWLVSNPDYCDFYAEDLVEYQRKSKGACAGHLLIISSNLHTDEISRLLIDTHPPFVKALGEDVFHKPNLAIINLATKQILCAGLVRKNYFCGFAIGNDQVLLNDGTVHQPSNQNEPTSRFMQEFCKHDYARVIPSLLESLYEFGCNARGWDSLPLNPELVQDILDAGPDADGMYEIDDEQKSKEEVDEILQDFAHYEEFGNEHLHTMQTYFPQPTWGDLNTQDY